MVKVQFLIQPDAVVQRIQNVCKSLCPLWKLWGWILIKNQSKIFLWPCLCTDPQCCPRPQHTWLQPDPEQWRLCRYLGQTTGLCGERLSLRRRRRWSRDVRSGDPRHCEKKKRIMIKYIWKYLFCILICTINVIFVRFQSFQSFLWPKSHFIFCPHFP